MSRLTPWLMLVVILAGCNGGPDTKQQQETMVSPKILADAVGEIKQEISVVQQTVSVVRQNFALDETRAKLEAKRLRAQEKEHTTTYLMMVGFILFAILVKVPVSPQWYGIIMIVAISLIAGAKVLPVFWPW